MEMTSIPVHPPRETSVKGLYLAGDIIYEKGGSIAMAINHAYDVLTDIVKKLLINRSLPILNLPITSISDK